MQTGDGKHKSCNGGRYHYRAYGDVEYSYVFVAKGVANFVYHKRQAQPPQHCAHDYGNETHCHVYGIVGSDKVKTRKQN